MQEVPPSPSSLAHSTMSTYLSRASRVSVQKMRERAPMASACEGGWSKVLGKMYIGDVPRSPNMTPTDRYTMAAKTSPLMLACKISTCSDEGCFWAKRLECPAQHTVIRGKTLIDYNEGSASGERL